MMQGVEQDRNTPFGILTASPVEKSNPECESVMQGGRLKVHTDAASDPGRRGMDTRPPGYLLPWM